MNKLSLFVLIAFIVTFTTAFSTNNEPTQWMQTIRTPVHINIDLTIAVKQQNTELLYQALKDVSDPASNLYGHHWTNQRVNKVFAPTHNSVQKIKQWLNSQGVDMNTLRTSPNEDFLTVTVNVADLERILETKYYAYQHVSNSEMIVHRCENYALPADIADHIDIIGPTTRFPLHAHKQVKSTLSSKRKSSNIDANPCANGVVPACLRQLYNIGNYQATNFNSSLAVNGFLEQYISLSDLKTFFTQYDPTSVGKVPNIVGPNDQSSPGVEASLDIQYIMGLGHGLNSTFWYTAGRAPNNTENEPFLVWLQALASDDEAPWVISTSYGDDYNTVDYDYAQRCNAEFAKAGVRGITLLFSSGDSGVGGDDPCTGFVPTFPAASPYVTAVGATQDYPEVAASFSSGGFSNYFPVPDYQTQAISNYFNKYGSNFPDSSLYNKSGRGFPDFACQGVDFTIVVSGQSFPVDGTSCSSPTCASMIALLNDARFNKGKSSLGFLNYFFYSNVTMFTDVTEGSNPGCGTPGFYAAKEWDPVTGLGTPDFNRWLSIVTDM